MRTPSLSGAVVSLICNGKRAYLDPPVKAIAHVVWKLKQISGQVVSIAHAAKLYYNREEPLSLLASKQ